MAVCTTAYLLTVESFHEVLGDSDTSKLADQVCRDVGVSPRKELQVAMLDDVRKTSVQLQPKLNQNAAGLHGSQPASDCIASPLYMFNDGGDGVHVADPAPLDSLIKLQQRNF